MCDKKEKQLELDKRYLRMAAVWAEKYRIMQETPGWGTDSKRPNDYL